MGTYAGPNALASKPSHRERKIREQSTFRFGPCFRLSMAKVGFSTRAGISSPTPKLLLYSENCVLRLAALATRNLTTVWAGILIFCCVLGLKPVRAFLFCFTNF